MREHDPKILIRLFNQQFADTRNTELVFGGDEPVYIPASETGGLNRIEFAHGYFNSALHEISHWCLAGSQRRTQRDYGYWYTPDGRNSEQQFEFEKVEARPQALEWIFMSACDARFYPSADNLGGQAGSMERFMQMLVVEVAGFYNQGLPEDARIFLQALHGEFKTVPLDASAAVKRFTVESLLL